MYLYHDQGGHDIVIENTKIFIESAGTKFILAWLGGIAIYLI